jgi:hypothetical protein
MQKKQVWPLNAERRVPVGFDCPQRATVRFDHALAEGHPSCFDGGQVVSSDNNDTNLVDDDDIMLQLSWVQVREMVGVRFL